MIRIRLCIIGQNCHRSDVPFSLAHFWGYMMLMYLITGNVNLPPLIKGVSARNSIVKLVFSFCVINKCIGGDTLRLYKYPFAFSVICFHHWVLPAIIKEELFFFSPFFIRSVIYLHEYGLMNLYFILWVIFQYCCYFVSYSFSNLAIIYRPCQQQGLEIYVCILTLIYRHIYF